ncbi:hypothetical protein, partial [Pantoea vagans]|uniref:hypothetical protein n=1 Tax=Pantoea vagans TaxID=470934 RepID=UPI0035E43EBE
NRRSPSVWASAFRFIASSPASGFMAWRWASAPSALASLPPLSLSILPAATGRARPMR